MTTLLLLLGLAPAWAGGNTTSKVGSGSPTRVETKTPAPIPRLPTISVNGLKQNLLAVAARVEGAETAATAAAQAQTAHGTATAADDRPAARQLASDEARDMSQALSSGLPGDDAGVLGELNVRFDKAPRAGSETAALTPVQESASRPLPAARAAAVSFKSGVPPPETPTPAQGRWERWTERLTDWAAVPFVALQAPQIWLNYEYLTAGQNQLLANLPWMGYSTGILANTLMLSYFVSMRQKSAARVQAIGVATSAVVVVQIFMASLALTAAGLSPLMPKMAFLLIMPAIVIALAFNYAHYKGRVSASAWTVWTRLSGLFGLVILPQVIWSSLPDTTSFLPAIASTAIGVGLLLLDWRDKLTGLLKQWWDHAGALTATFLFMFGPIAQLLKNFLNPEGMAGISVATLLLAMTGNMLMLPAAMRVWLNKKEWPWFVGSLWGVALGGWAVLAQMWAAGLLARDVPLIFGLSIPAVVANALPMAMAVIIPAYLASAYILNRRN